MLSQGVDPSGRTIVRDDAVAFDTWLEEEGISHRTVEVTIGQSQ